MTATPASPAFPAPAFTTPATPSIRPGLLLAGGLAALMLVIGVMTWLTRAHAPVYPAPVAQLDRLPARPADIEAHGVQAKSVLDPDDARARNLKVPFLTGPVEAARSFAFRGSDEDRARALACLATAVLYEAGDDVTGQAAVAQVILNRVRHPAFPGTVCGVVYQGSQRVTGCQFTFTCDGSLGRPWPDAAWRRAREVAGRALAGSVDATVGLATHYHTNWVYPYWSPSLNKLAQVGTHLFFGWPGRWGGPPAFARPYRGGEPMPGRALATPGVTATDAAGLVTDSLAGGQESAIPGIGGYQAGPAKLPAGMERTPLYGSRVRLVRPDGRAFGLLAGSGVTGAKLVSAALALCDQPGACQVQAWANEDDIPGAYPIPAGTRGTMVFEYIRDAGGGQSALRFDCDRYPNKDPKRCLRAAPDELSGLTGVRWKSKPKAEDAAVAAE